MSIKRGEIYFVNLNPTQGREQAGNRPVLVLSINKINSLPLVITVIVGTKGENIKQNFPTNVRVTSEESGLPIETVFLGFQVRSLDRKRFPAQATGQLSTAKMQDIETAVRYCLGL
ncbi:type II toxin-antitoxin system PemK/MazF family toxin [Spirulina major CS-329]|uniref:type II toxin-antitoxin system PemK/MazF family toxin n=1 Tax=Spirulina TaxID=1154 RepID=UPI00232BC5CD|nr:MULTISPECIES: type II toxin-antitoxin system PemK/MazF family toxin [Spirulina]MDB9494779.1 type II toxin-antitoxin system PemK/MazF family toxin [Spirulina subsalsa CS-330]MDB9503901.1 type II toxin-antitoxin system PemK/MazF family toxin [Spirulina major CS-329]